MPRRFPDNRVPVVLSAHAAALLATDAAALLSYLADQPAVEVSAVAAQLVRTRRIRRYRAVVRAGDRAELISGLTAVVDGLDHPLVARSSEGAAPRLAFVLPGQGNQWPGMGADGYTRLPAYRAEADTFAAVFPALGVSSPLGYLLGDVDTEHFSQIEIQGAQFVHAVSLAAVWRTCGVLPDLTVGHSLGEVAAAYLAGAITAEAAAAVVTARAGVVTALSGRYGMAVLGMSVETARDLMSTASGWLELSVVNSGSSVVVSGDRDAVTELVARAEAQGRFARRIDVDFPAHTSALEPLRSDLLARLPAVEFTDAPIQFIGSATADVVTADAEFADYWYANLRNTVRFDLAARAAVRRGATAFVELSAHPALQYALDDVLEDALPEGPAVLVGSGRRDEPLIETLSANIAAAAVTDPNFRWADQLVLSGATLPGFPNAPMHTTSYWAAATPLPPVPTVTVAAEKWVPVIPKGAAPESLRVAVLDLGNTELGAGIAAHPRVGADEAGILVVIAACSSTTDAPTAARELAASIEDGLLGYADARYRNIWLLTVGAAQTSPDDPAPSPGQAAMAALHRSVGFELPDNNFHHLDLPMGFDDHNRIVELLLTGHGDMALRVRDGEVVTLRRELDDNPPQAPGIDTAALDSVVITGGSGSIALQFARHLVARGARRIVLLSRRGTDAASVREFIRTIPPGVDVHAPSCDITDREAVAAAAAEHAGHGASLVIHAAGTATFATRDQLHGADFEAMTAAKLVGLAQVADLWPLRADARMLLCSSVIGVWGGKGVAGYAAANRMLDAMAAQLRHRGRRCVSVRWGLWQGSDIIDASEIGRVERAGLRQMAPAPAIDAGLRDHASDPLVLSADPDRLRAFFGSQEATADTPAAEAAGSADSVRAELITVLDITDRPLDPAATLFDLGMDSLLALDLRKRIKRVTGRTIPLATLLGGITVRELIATFDESELSSD